MACIGEGLRCPSALIIYVTYNELQGGYDFALVGLSVSKITEKVVDEF